jgi:hypothetical protein
MPAMRAIFLRDLAKAKQKNTRFALSAYRQSCENALKSGTPAMPRAETKESRDERQ